jgi:tetratricopeptide (TPR) repeat protein
MFLLSFKLIFADSFPEEFNKSVVFSEQKEFKKAIEVLEGIKDLPPKNEYKYKYLYQLGTLYCLDNKTNECIKYLSKAFKLNPNDNKLKKNLEIAFLKNEKKSKKNNKNSNNEKKNKESKKSEFNKKFQKQLSSLKYTEGKIQENKFKKKMNFKNNNFVKDW